MKKQNDFKIRFKLWTQSFHFKRFTSIMIVVLLIVLINCLQGNYDSIIAIPLTILLFGGLTLFPKLFPGEGLDLSLEDKIEKEKQKNYEEWIKSPEYIRQQREKKLKRI